MNVPGDTKRTWRSLQRWRLASQITALAVLFVIPLLNWYGIHWLIGTLYSLSLGELVIMDPLMALQTVLLNANIWLGLIIAAGVPALLALLLGRVFCSWLCPHNTITEWFDLLKRKLFRHAWYLEHKKRIAGNPTPLRYWLIFSGLIVLMLLLGFPIFGYLSPPGIISTAIAHAMTGHGVPLEFTLVLVILLVEAVIGKRYWCNLLCPVGAMLSLFRTRNTLAVRHDPALCDCKGDIAPCHFICPLNLSPKSENLYPFCYNCGLCVSVCEKTGSRSLSLQYGASEYRTQNAPASCGTENCPLSQ